MKKIYFLIALICAQLSNAQIINIPDANFKAKLLMADVTNNIASNENLSHIKIDSNNDGEIQLSEALQVRYLYIDNSNISSLEGINSFTDLRYFMCKNNLLTSIDVSEIPNLYSLDCSQNQISTMVLSNNFGLYSLNFSHNLMTAFTCPTSVGHLTCSYNHLTTLDVSGCNFLQSIQCPHNQLQNLVIVNKPNLITLSCSFNQLTSLNLSNISSSSGYNQLGVLECSDNQLTTLNANNLKSIGGIYCENNLLNSLFIKNGKNESLDFSGNPNLNYICADDSQFTNVETLISENGYTDCFVNSYCTLDPGGSFYNIQGFARLDSNGNGCDASDVTFSTLALAINNGSSIANYYTNGSYNGLFNYNVQSGNYTIAPVLEMPAYFNISPASAIVSFPSQSSPYQQNFCLTPNGTHPDLEIAIIPTTAATPGFDAGYKILYKNKGNTTQSGTLSIDFDDSTLDFVSANPVFTTQSAGNLLWDFSNLLPFETRTITLVYNLNSPMESPAMNSGDIINYTVSLNSASTDDTPADNVFELRQTVVNSYDPNDKVCLEGTTVGVEKIGDYVHYTIRFENMGTATAQNIVVTDVLDSSMFDLSSLVTLSGSHPFVTRINGGKVEFLFKSIYLSATSPANKGFLAFKIKTSTTLTSGDTFSNSASIYFDYNYPIVTDPAVTMISVLKNKDFEFDDYVTVYPNPANAVLNLKSQNIEITSISIYNALGQQVLAVANAQETKSIEVANLKPGSYFLKISTDKGVSNTTFIKQ